MVGESSEINRAIKKKKKDKDLRIFPVMLNFMRQLDRAMRCLDIWSNIILGVSVMVFLDDINI